MINPQDLLTIEYGRGNFPQAVQAELAITLAPVNMPICKYTKATLRIGFGGFSIGFSSIQCSINSTGGLIVWTIDAPGLVSMGLTSGGLSVVSSTLMAGKFGLSPW